MRIGKEKTAGRDPAGEMRKGQSGQVFPYMGSVVLRYAMNSSWLRIFPDEKKY